MSTPASTPAPASRRDRVFISYSHLDREWLARLGKILDPDKRNDRIDYWDDRELKPGDPWYAHILESIDRARAAILLVSPNFLKSKFIIQVELPRILEARAEGLAIFWVPLSGTFHGPGAIDGAEKIISLQAAFDPAQPLAALPQQQQTARLIDLCRQIDRLMNPNRVPNNLPFRSLLDLFVGREPELEALDRSFAQHGAEHGAAAITQPQTISGLGGIGKTRLAVEYAWARQDRFRALLFARAGSPDDLRAGLASLSRSEVLDLVEQAGAEDQQYAAVVRWLQKNRDWLLILDNVDSAEGVRAVQEMVARIPGGQALITSRLTNWGGAIRQTRIDVLGRRRRGSY